MDNRPKTIFVDIDGVIFKHYGSLGEQTTREAVLLPGVREKMCQWEREGCCIVLVTGRKEPTRGITEYQLNSHGIPYDQLIMGVTGGIRVLINDFKPNSTELTAHSICLTRNTGLKEIL